MQKELLDDTFVQYAADNVDHNMMTSYFKTETSGLMFKQTHELQSPYTLLQDITTDLLWHTSYFFHQNDRPSYSSFMQTHTIGEYPGQTSVTMLPIINLSPSDETCIYSTLIFI